MIIRNAFVHQLVADANGETYQLFVQVPYKYSESDATYPVIYLLDGDQFVGMVTDTVRLLQHAREMPDVIIVGIGYGTDTSDHFVQRIRDYSLSAIDKYPYGGGAEAFHHFLSNQVPPLINATYLCVVWLQ